MPVKIDGARRRLPIGPRGKACSKVAKASASMESRNMSEISAAEAPAARPMTSG